MQLPNLLPKWIRNKAAEPEGAAPKNLVFKGGVALLAVVMAGVVLLTPNRQGEEEEAAVEPALKPPAGPAAVSRGEQQIEQAEQLRRLEESRQQRAEQQAAERARQMEEAWRTEQEQERAAARAAGGAGAGADGEELTPEQELYQSIRLEKIQRRHDSLRASPVALSFRLAEGEPARSAPEAATAAVAPQAAVATPVARRPAAAAPERPEPATPAEQALEEGDLEVAEARPRDPRGWERIDGGQWIEAVLVTQIRGDAPGPAIALVSTPFWSRDRQRILIPRGARFVGRAQAVSGWDQARLTVTFDRLIFDNYNLRLPFAGLSQAGEAGLKDQVNRHYLATFGAAGAVGVIAGLTLRNTQSAGFNVPAGQAARMEAGRSLGESASAIMQRYLNRLPTITIRAGHRIRIYFTSDLLVPRRPA